MRGDRIEIVVDTGDGVQTFDVVATRAGRRVEASTSRSVVEVVELTRGGTIVRTARFMANRVVALVEHPASEQRRPSPTPDDALALALPDAG
ncbi:MAG TPA: hypothetical protein VK923_10165 [Euzebyales bacterium]|nr:hypothetical protein [Euzebyales bacterium]